jgi:hypothetical protein
VSGLFAGCKQPRGIILGRAESARGHDKTQNLKTLHHIERRLT